MANKVHKIVAINTADKAIKETNNLRCAIEYSVKDDAQLDADIRKVLHDMHDIRTRMRYSLKEEE